jgi:hypothetical protein
VLKVELAHSKYEIAPTFNKKNHMKLQILVILLLGITITNQTYAGEKPAKPTASHKSVLNYFMESYLHTDHKMLKEVLSPNAVYTSNRNDEVITHSASDILNFMKQNYRLEQQDCEANATILSESDAIVIARVDIHYQLFEGDQENFLIIEKNKSGEWRIAKVYKVFLGKEKAKTKKVIAKI